jgi:hypothetical protein
MTKNIFSKYYYVEVFLQKMPLLKLYAENLKKYVKTEILKIFPTYI